MLFNLVYFLTVINFLFHRITSEPLLSANGTPSIENYSSNTPFASESDMESFIRNEWRDYPTIDKQSLISPLKEILYSTFNPDNTKIKVCKDLSFSTYKNHQIPKISEHDEIYVITPSSLIPLKYFKWVMELMIVLNDDDIILQDRMATAMKNLDGLESDGEIVKFIKNCQAVVVVPHLFKSNSCVIGPIIDSYFPALANVSLIKLGNIFLRYNSVKNFAQKVFHQTWNDVGNELENIPISETDEITFENFRTIVENFQKNHSSFYLKTIDEHESAEQTDVPLSHWTIVYDSLNTDVREYLKSIVSENGSQMYENLPRVEYRTNGKNIEQSNMVSILIPANIPPTEKSYTNGSRTRNDTVNENQYDTSFVPASRYFTSRENFFSYSNVSDRIRFRKLYSSDDENVVGSGDGSLDIDDSDDKLNGEKKSTIREKNDTSLDLDSLILRQVSHVFHGLQNHHENQSPVEPNSITNTKPDKRFSLFHHDEKISDKNETKNTPDHNINFSTQTSFTDSCIESFKMDDNLLTALHSSCKEPNIKSNSNLKNINGHRSRIRHHIGTATRSKSHRSNLFKDTGLKKFPRNDPITNKRNRNPVIGKFARLKKDKIRSMGRHSTPISGNLVATDKKSGVQITINLKDNLVEELQNTFESSHVQNENNL